MRPWRRVDVWSLPADQILCNPIDGQQTANRRATVFSMHPLLLHKFDLCYYWCHAANNL